MYIYVYKINKISIKDKYQYTTIEIVIPTYVAGRSASWRMFSNRFLRPRLETRGKPGRRHRDARSWAPPTHASSSYMRNPDDSRDDMFAKHRKTARTVINPAAISRRTPAARAWLNLRPRSPMNSTRRQFRLPRTFHRRKRN